MIIRGGKLHPNRPGGGAATSWPVSAPASAREPAARGLARRWSAALAGVIAVLVLAAPAGAATATSTWQVVAGPAVANGELYAVAGLGPFDVWAVGDHFTASAADKTLTEHWNGAAWQVVPSPGPGNWNQLRAVAPITASDVWAVGFTTSYATLVLHWNGTSWARVASPAFGADRPLYGVAAFGPGDVWAVGSAGAATFVLHYDGTSWRRVPAPSPGSPANLTKVAGSGPDDIWAVGDGYGPRSDATVMLHYNGTAWTQVPAPHPGAFDYIRGLAVRSADDAWFTGEWDSTTPGGNYTPHPFIGHWNGTAWTQVSSPAGQTVYGVAADTASDGWVVGNNGSPEATFAAALEHWNGTTWSLAPSPVTGPGESALNGITVLAGGTFWAAGSRQVNGTFIPLTLRLTPS